jgi:hypothetical protein
VYRLALPFKQLDVSRALDASLFPGPERAFPRDFAVLAMALLEWARVHQINAVIFPTGGGYLDAECAPTDTRWVAARWTPLAYLTVVSLRTDGYLEDTEAGYGDSPLEALAAAHLARHVPDARGRLLIQGLR